MSYTEPMTLPQAIRRAGATQTSLTPPPRNIDPLLRHCGQPMAETLDHDTRTPHRYYCQTCGTSITHIDHRGALALTNQQRAQLGAERTLWVISTDPNSVLTNRGTGGTAHA